MKNRRLTIFIVIGLIGVTSMLAQVPVNFENHFVRPLGDVLRGISEQFNVKFRYGIDTTGLNLNYADSRIRAYSLDGSECNEKKLLSNLMNLCLVLDQMERNFLISRFILIEN